MTLPLYIIRSFFWYWFLVLAVFGTLMFTVDIIDHLRLLVDHDAPLPTAMKLALINLPKAISELQPLIVMLATLSLFLAFARRSELVIIRAAGRSLLSNLGALIGAVLVLGLVDLIILNPLVAATQKAYEQEVSDLEPGQRSVFSLAENGVWLRQGDESGQTVIHAERTSLSGTSLYRASFLIFDAQGQITERISARRAQLQPGAWELHGVKRWDLVESRNPERDALEVREMSLASSLTIEEIRDSFGTPSTISIFALPTFIAKLKEAGFAAQQHLVWFALELAKPLLLVAMMMIGASLTMGHMRAGQTGVKVLLALVMGFGIYFMRNFAQVLGENGQLSLYITALAPPLAGIALSLGLILHLEDG